MARVKNFYHEEICGEVDVLGDAASIEQAARERLALRIAKPRSVTAILNGEWDDTPAYRYAYGEEFLYRRGSQRNPPIDLLTIALLSLLEVSENAIEAGDWKVDGVCDPALAIEKGRRALACVHRTKAKA